MFERDSYSVREDAGSLMYRVIATGTASFDYEVVITGVDGSATCELRWSLNSRGVKCFLVNYFWQHLTVELYPLYRIG